jgi:hypothetical protein
MPFLRPRRPISLLFAVAGTALLAAISRATPCGPFTDVGDTDPFCPSVLEIFTLGITVGTTPTTYDPSGDVTRLQMAAFLSRTVDRALLRGSRRAALDQFWTPQNETVLDPTTVGSGPALIRSDGADLWVANTTGNSVARARGSDGTLIETWTGATEAYGVLVAMRRIFVTGRTSPGNLYQIDPTQPAGAVTTVAATLGNTPFGLAFDGSRIWTANFGGSVSIVTPGGIVPWTVTTVTTGFTALRGALFDGSNIWVTDYTAGNLLKLDGAGAILQTVTVGSFPYLPVFDGTNIWVPMSTGNAVTVVRASNGSILATLTGNGLNAGVVAAFDGQRVLVTNINGNSVSLWKAADLSPLGSVLTGASTGPLGACSDGTTFWVTFDGTGQIARF